MNTISTSVKDRVAIITLNRGKSNAINHEMVVELSSMLDSIETDENIGGVIISGRDNFFSAGLDLIELYHYDENQARDFWTLFLGFIGRVVRFKKPIISAINGHSPAGGCVIALACDARIMAEGKYIIGLNEVPVGIIVPNSIFQLYSFWIGKPTAYRSLLEGKLFSPEEALNVGLVDELAKPESILTTAERKLRKYMAFEPNTWQQSKLNLREDLIKISSADQSEDLEKMLNQWWSQSTRAILKSLIDGLQKPKS